MNNHQMITRSKKPLNDGNIPDPDILDDNNSDTDVDDHDNIKDLIDYSYDKKIKKKKKKKSKKGWKKIKWVKCVYHIC